MMSLILGLVLLGLTAFWAQPSEGLENYFQMHSIVLVGLGTMALMCMTFSMATLRNSLTLIKHLFKSEKSLLSYEDKIKEISLKKQSTVEVDHPLVGYAQQLWEQGINPDLFIVLLSEKKTELESRNMDVIVALKNLAKYPPALGMVGTVMGMIDLFSSLEANQEHIGQALSITMTATFFGLIVSNLLIAPLADRLHVQHMKEERLTTSLYELLLLINGNQPNSLIEEEIKGRAA